MTDTQKGVAYEVIKATRMVRSEEAFEHAKDILVTFAKDCTSGGFGELASVNNVISVLQKKIAEIDDELCEQINEVIHNEEFKTLESRYRSVYDFVEKADPNEKLMIRVMSVKKEEILEDCNNAADFDQAIMFKKIYEDEFGTLGGTPFSFIVADYYIGKSNKDMKFMEGFAEICAAAHCPIIMGAHHEIFGVDSMPQINDIHDVSGMFNTAEYDKWQKYRLNHHNAYITLALPRVIQRQPWGNGYQEVENFKFNEKMKDGSDNSTFLWGNAAFVLAERITNSINVLNWPMAIQGLDWGGSVTNLAKYSFKNKDNLLEHRIPTEMLITDRKEHELSELGFTVLCPQKGTHDAVFFACNQVYKVEDFADAKTKEAALLNTKLTNILMVSRIAHYFKFMMVRFVGSTAGAAEISGFLNGWLGKYCCPTAPSSAFGFATFPLAGASVSVERVDGKLGAYRAFCKIKPHEFMTSVSIEIKLVTDLAA